jgi:5-methylcytosine-specific restriction enzyme A
MTKATTDRPWQQWYGLQRWRNRAAMQMKIEPLCVMCLKRGVVEPATVADHIEPHRGDPNKFWFGKLQSLCYTDHSSTKAKLDHGKQVEYYRSDIGIDGWPIDTKHPVYKQRDDM